MIKLTCIKKMIAYSHSIENALTRKLSDSISKYLNFLNSRFESIQLIIISIPGILSKGKKLNDHVNNFIPDRK